MLKSPLRLCDIEYNKTILRLLFDFLLECEPYKYGPDCATQCGHCKGGGSCSMDTGIVPVDAHTVGSGTAVIYVGCIPQEIRTYLQLAMPVNHI